MVPVPVRHYRGKRSFDIALLALLALPATAIGVIAGLAVRLTSRGPVLFRQERVGAGGVSFVLLKLRTMVHIEGDHDALPDDDQITAVGRFLRRWSLDELPQLVNVFRGDMSIVGPRPTLAYQVERYSDRQRLRLAVRPGLTGLAQVRGRNALAWSERIEIDLEYIERQGFALDVWVLGTSLVAVMRGSGVVGHPTDDPLAAPEGPEGGESR